MGITDRGPNQGCDDVSDLGIAVSPDSLEVRNPTARGPARPSMHAYNTATGDIQRCAAGCFAQHSTVPRVAMHRSRHLTCQPDLCGSKQRRMPSP